jgi:hypothetical protein
MTARLGVSLALFMRHLCLQSSFNDIKRGHCAFKVSEIDHLKTNKGGEYGPSSGDPKGIKTIQRDENSLVKAVSVAPDVAAIAFASSGSIV